MFPLTAQRRLVVCRALFLSFAVVPTLWVCSWAFAWNLPSHARGYQHALAGSIGRHVHFAEIAHPRPGVMRLVDIELENPETGDSILTADVLEAEASGDQLTVAIDGVRCAPGGLPELLDLLAEQLSGHWETTAGPRALGRVHVMPSQWTVLYDETGVSGEAGAQTLDDVEIDLRLRDGVPWARLQFRLPDRNGDETDAPITIEWDRNRGITPPTTGLVLDTGTSALPCGLLQAVFPDFDLLGSRATFRGKASLQLHSTGWHGSLTGELRDVPLGRLLTGQSGLLLSGEADIDVKEALLHDGRLIKAGGTIRAAGGSINQALLVALAGCDGLVVAVPQAQPGAIHRYEDFACTVQLGSSGLSLTAPNGSGVIMAAAGTSQPLILETVATLQPLALAAALLPDSEVMIPATQRAATLMRWLPLPPAVAEKSPGDRIALPQGSLNNVRPLGDDD